jgi:hypothetical protein
MHANRHSCLLAVFLNHVAYKWLFLVFFLTTDCTSIVNKPRHPFRFFTYLSYNSLLTNHSLSLLLYTVWHYYCLNIQYYNASVCILSDILIYALSFLIILYVYIYTHTHTHTHIYICIYISAQNVTFSMFSTNKFYNYVYIFSTLIWNKSY